MNLCRFYPPILWNTARLLVESDSTENMEYTFTDGGNDEDAEVEKSSVNYFKLASAIGTVRRHGVSIEKPNINKSGFVFKPIIEENKIYFGLAGIAGIGAPLVQELMEKRPFNSPQEVLDSTSLNRLQVINLIKAGCFDELYIDRLQLLEEFCGYVADTKTELNMRNIALLVRLGILPNQFEQHITLWKLKEFMNKHCKFGDIYVPQESMWQYLGNYDLEPSLSEDGEPFFMKSEFDAFVTKYLVPVKNYIKDNKAQLLHLVNQAATQEIKDKYYQPIEEGELHALSFYYSQSALLTEPFNSLLDKLRVQRFYNLPEDPVIEWQNDDGAKKFALSRIAVSCVGRDRNKRIVGALDLDNNFIQVKINRNTFVKFDKQITTELGREMSWFGKSSHLVLTGYRDGDMFTVKSYKNSTPAIAKILRNEDGAYLIYDREE